LLNGLLKANSNPSPWWFVTLAVLGSSVVLIYGPMFAPEYKFSMKQVRCRKSLGAFVLALLTVLNIWCQNRWLTFLIAGVILSVMLRTPIGVWIVQQLEQITKEKEVHFA